MDDGSWSQLLSLLSPTLPYLVAAGDTAARKVAEKAGQALGDGTWDTARKVWVRLRPSLEARESGKEAVEDLRTASGDDLALNALLHQVRKVVQADPDLLRELLGEIGGVTVNAPGGVVVGGNTGSIISVNAETIQLFLNHVLGGVAAPEPEVDLHEVTRQYLQLILDRYSFLELKGMGVTDRVALQLPLLELYVPLKARVAMPDGETWDRDVRVAGRRPGDEEVEAMGRRPGGPQPVLELLAENDGLIVLGDPGSGKTTLLKYLALNLAAGQGEALGLGNRLPVLLPLAAYATALDSGAPTLRQFMAEYAEARGVDLPVAPILDRAIESGRALLLLDGLDEVADLARRNHVVGSVKDLVSRHCCNGGNKYLLTSRIVGYREVRPTFPGRVGECTLVDFDDDEISAFIGHWTATIERSIGLGSATALRHASEEQRELLETVRRSPPVRRLASNPLLLTILALMKRQGVTLPEHRVELYDRYVATMLRTWNLARSLDIRSARELDLGATLRVLAPLAFWMQETDPGRGLVARHALDECLREVVIGKDEPEREQAAQRFMKDLREHAGLLLDRGGNQFGFIHLTFQEYLAAVALARKGQQSIEPIYDALAPHFGDPAWYETSLLTVGYLGLIQKREEAASALVEALLQRQPGDPGEAVVLAGEAVADSSPGGVSDTCRAAAVEALVATMQRTGDVPAARRLAAGAALARLGDPLRPEVMTVDAMQLCYVPPGPFWMGAAEGDDEAADREKPGHELDLPYGYWIGRFPITVAQLRELVDVAGFEPGDPDCLEGQLNAPAVWVSWHEARRLCESLSSRWARLGWLDAGWTVRLPSEAEWEKAARGGLWFPQRPIIGGVQQVQGRSGEEDALSRNDDPSRLYPWGGSLDSDRAHLRHVGIMRPCAVGCFGHGASPVGCEEMVGSVWEWTRSLWGDDWQEPGFLYPYQVDDQREDEQASDDVLRVVRGGAFGFDPQNARCSCRSGLAPEARGGDMGIRVVVAPFL